MMQTQDNTEMCYRRGNRRTRLSATLQNQKKN